MEFFHVHDGFGSFQWDTLAAIGLEIDSSLIIIIFDLYVSHIGISRIVFYIERKYNRSWGDFKKVQYAFVELVGWEWLWGSVNESEWTGRHISSINWLVLTVHILEVLEIVYFLTVDFKIDVFPVSQVFVVGGDEEDVILFAGDRIVFGFVVWFCLLLAFWRCEGTNYSRTRLV